MYLQSEFTDLSSILSDYVYIYSLSSLSWPLTSVTMCILQSEFTELASNLSDYVFIYSLSSLICPLSSVTMCIFTV